MLRSLDRFFRSRNAIHHIFTALWIFFAVQALLCRQWFALFIYIVLIVAFNYMGVRGFCLKKYYWIRYSLFRKRP